MTNIICVDLCQKRGMKPLIILLSVFIISLLELKLFQSNFGFAFSGKIAIPVMLTFTVAVSFVFIQGMAMMLPRFIPYMVRTLCPTGIIETSEAGGITIPAFRVITGWLLISFPTLILPANVYAVIKHNDYKKETYKETGLNYLLPGIHLQILFKDWTYLPVIKSNNIIIEKPTLSRQLNCLYTAAFKSAL